MNVGWKKSGRGTLLQILMVCAVCFFCGCGQMQNDDVRQTDIEQEGKNENEIANESENGEEAGINEETGNDDIVTGLLTNDTIDTIKDSIYRYYYREETEKLSKEEILAVKGKLSATDLTIHSGEEFALIREWYDWDHSGDISVVFSEDLQDWQEEDLEALALLKGSVYVESSGETFPARALTYLTGSEKLIFSYASDMTDVSGIFSEGSRFPQQVKEVCLDTYREGKYKTLLQLLRDSQVERIEVKQGWEADAFQGFWLDDVAGISTLRELELESVPIRVRDEASLKACGLERIAGYADQETDWCFLDRLSALKELTCSVVEEMDLSPLLGREELSLYLRFSRLNESFEEADYGEIHTVCPAFNREVSWPGEAGDERFPAIYQRNYDQGRMVECFTDRHVCENKMEGIHTEPYNPWIRVTDGSVVYELRPGEGESEEYKFGDFREDKIRFQDINFDGTKDIVLEAGRFGAQASRGEFGYLWNQKTGRYEFSPTYTEIANPVIDTEHQMVRSAWRNWAASHSWSIYRFENGEFIRQRMLTEEVLTEDKIPEELEVPEEASVLCWQEEIFENGEVAEEKRAYAVQIEGEETVYPEECENYREEYWVYPYWSYFEDQ